MASEPDTPPDDPQPVEVAPGVVADEVAPAPSEPLPTLDRAGLTAAAISARENNETTRLMDGLNREWLIGTANVQNRSTVLIQARKGDVIRERYLSTDTFTPDTAQAAIAELDGELP